MSLINDALKRAKQFEKKQAPSIPPLETPFVDGQITTKRPEWIVPVLLCTLAAAALFIGLAFLIFERKPAQQLTAAVVVPPPVQAIVTPKPSSPPAPVTNQTAAVTALVSAAPSAPPSPPPLHVQGISYSNAKWQAIVNGRTVFVGDSVNGFRVSNISKNNVSFIAPGGSQKTLALGAQ
jgi:hypothetical protein